MLRLAFAAQIACLVAPALGCVALGSSSAWSFPWHSADSEVEVRAMRAAVS